MPSGDWRPHLLLRREECVTSTFYLCSDFVLFPVWPAHVKFCDTIDKHHASSENGLAFWVPQSQEAACQENVSMLAHPVLSPSRLFPDFFHRLDPGGASVVWRDHPIQVCEALFSLSLNRDDWLKVFLACLLFCCLSVWAIDVHRTVSAAAETVKVNKCARISSKKIVRTTDAS